MRRNENLIIDIASWQADYLGLAESRPRSGLLSTCTEGKLREYETDGHFQTR